MSAKYTLKNFMCDFIAIWKNAELQRLGISRDRFPHLAHAFFREHYGDNAEEFGALHMKAVNVLCDYGAKHRPVVAKEVERAPNSLLIAIFYLVAEKGIENPTREQIELAEANHSPQN